MRLSKLLIGLIAMFLGMPTFGQLKNTEIIAEANQYYVFPVQPGQSNYLSGTMGELRSGHFHGGLDIKTGGKVGLKVHATATGYISRIKISEGGYGNALYMAHPNGTTSVYGHLKEFNSTIANYVRSAQYKKESFTIELFPDKGALKFSKGEVIGYSGNSGSSGGPHLHFEIRDGAQKPINPLKFGFSEIKDNIPPAIYKMALVTMDHESRVNHQFGRFEFDVIKKGSYYTTDRPIKAYGRIGIELLAYDKLNGANNRNGVPCIELQMDGAKLFNQNISTFAFSETRDILVHTNYEVHKTTGKRFNKLYVDEGNKLKFYETNEDKGVLKINRDGTHEVNINLWDKYNNASVLNFKIEGTSPVENVQLGKTDFADKSGYQILENTMLIYKSEGPSDCQAASIFSQRMNYKLAPAYRVNNSTVYLWNMDQGLPDSVQLCGGSIHFPYVATIPGGKSFSFYHDNINLTVPANALYDTVFLKLNYNL
ncbi:MAG: M23 family metallopeptidase, partial [Cyclobacteriaceae bacterium]